MIKLKLPFLMRKGFNFIDKVEGKKLIVDIVPKKNFWFYLFAFVESFKYIISDFKGYEKVSDIDEKVADFIFDKTRMSDSKNKFCVIGSNKEETECEIIWVDTFRDASECWLKCKAEKKQMVIARADDRTKGFVIMESGDKENE